MRRAGTVSRTAGGLAVIRREDGEYLDLGTEVVDESLSAVGRVVDVFGPVSRPYLAVSPREGLDPADLLGETLYAR